MCLIVLVGRFASYMYLSSWCGSLVPAGRNRGAIISQYCNRTARLRRRSNRAPFQEVSRSARPSLRQLGLELDSGQEEEDGKSVERAERRYSGKGMVPTNEE